MIAINGPQDLNAIRRALASGELTEADLAGMTIRGGGLQPQQAVEPPANAIARALSAQEQFAQGGGQGNLPVGSMRNEATGGVTYFKPGGGGFSDKPYSQGPQEQRAKGPQEQRAKVRVVGVGSRGDQTDLGEEDARALPVDYTRPGIEIPGLGKGRYTADGRFAVIANPDGSQTKVVLGYDADASDRRNARDLARKKVEADISATEEQIAASKQQRIAGRQAAPVFNADLGAWVFPPSPDSPTGRAVTPIDASGNPVDAKEKKIPQGIVEGLTTNLRSIQTIDNALNLMKTPEGKAGVGWKGYLPNKLLNEYVDPSGVDARAAIADVGSLQVKSRSGATVTAAEEPRLLPWIPLPTDDDATVVKKLIRLKMEIEKENVGISEFYPSAEKKIESIKQKTSAPISESKQAPARIELNSMPMASQYPGKLLTTPEGQKYRSDGKQWVRQ